MKIVVKNSELTKETITAINTLIEADINANCAFKLTRIIKELSSIVEDKVTMEKKILEKWIEMENGAPKKVIDGDGNIVKDAVNIVDVKAFSKDMQDLQAVENTLSYDKINFDDLNLTSAKVKDLMKLEFLFN